MARILEAIEIAKRLKEIHWEYISPEYPLIHEHHEFVFKNPNGKKITFSFDEVFNWMYNPEYVGCGHDCETCLTPIC